MSTIKHRLIFFPTSSFTATWNLHCNPIPVIKFSGKFNFFFHWKKITIAFKVVYYINKICIVQMETWDSKHNINQISELLVWKVGLKPAITETPCLDRVGHQRTPEKITDTWKCIFIVSKHMKINTIAYFPVIFSKLNRPKFSICF